MKETIFWMCFFTGVACAVYNVAAGTSEHPEDYQRTGTAVLIMLACSAVAFWILLGVR